MPFFEKKRAIEAVLSVFCMEEVGQGVKMAYFGNGRA